MLRKIISKLARSWSSCIAQRRYDYPELPISMDIYLETDLKFKAKFEEIFKNHKYF